MRQQISHSAVEYLTFSIELRLWPEFNNFSARKGNLSANNWLRSLSWDILSDLWMIKTSRWKIIISNRNIIRATIFFAFILIDKYKYLKRLSSWMLAINSYYNFSFHIYSKSLFLLIFHLYQSFFFQDIHLFPLLCFMGKSIQLEMNVFQDVINL
jgi:hypothetical protein